MWLKILALAIFSSLSSLSEESTAPISPINAQNGSFQKTHNSLIFQIQEATLKLARLESVFEKNIQDSNAKTLYIRQLEDKIEGLNHDILRMQTTFASFQDPLEEEVRLLWAAKRKNNFEIHKLEFRAHDAEKRLNVVRSQVEEMAEIVSEQWIQIQQLEQAVQLTQVRAMKVKRQLSSIRCPFVKFLVNSLGEFLEMLKVVLNPYASFGGSVLKSSISEALHHIKRVFTAAKDYHHQLQGCIKQLMLRNEFTTLLAHEEVVFFVASALVTFPLLSVFMLLSSHFS